MGFPEAAEGAWGLVEEEPVADDPGDSASLDPTGPAASPGARVAPASSAFGLAWAPSCVGGSLASHSLHNSVASAAAAVAAAAALT